MQSKLGFFLALLSVLILGVGIGVLFFGPKLNPSKGGGVIDGAKAGDPQAGEVKGDGKNVPRTPLPPPPPPPVVKDDNRVRETLKAGRTYRATSDGVLTMKGTDRDWGITATHTIVYGFHAEIDRHVEFNDGVSIVELRTFRNVTTWKVAANLDDLRADLGPAGTIVIGAIAAFKPELVPAALGARRFAEGGAITEILKQTGLDGHVARWIADRDPTARMTAQVGSFNGKVVRLRYRNQANELCIVEEVHGQLNPEEKNFLRGSVLLADAHVFPNMEVREGDQWSVPGNAVTGMLDPTLLVFTAGEVRVERDRDQLAPAVGERAMALKIVSGSEITFRKMDSKAQIDGFFRPQGRLKFGRDSKIVLDGEMTGDAKLTSLSRDHLLFEARSTRTPTLKVKFSQSILP